MQGFFFERNTMVDNFKVGMSDSHFHIMEMKRREMDIELLFRTLKDAGAGILLDAGVQLDDFSERISWADHYEQLYFAAGIHPNIPKNSWSDNYIEILKEQVNHPLVKAIGETGLDLFREYSPLPDQKALLNTHYEISQETEKPLIFHIRNAEDEMIHWILERDFKTPAVLHCFPGNKRLAEVALEKGFYISYAGNVTFKNASNIRDSLKIVPLDRILVETDAPYLAPHPKRGRDNHPGLIAYTYECIALEKNIDVDDLIPRVDKNLKAFLKLS
jgi:TatD DNase family protein